MPVSLKKGEKVNLTKDNPELKKVLVGLGWDVNEFESDDDFDLDASAILLSEGKLLGKKDVVYFGNLRHASGSVIHQGDNLTGEGDGDDEQIMVYLSNVPQKFDRIVIVVNIYNADDRNQHFGMIQNSFIRIEDASKGTEICRFNLSDDYSGMTAMIFGELYRYKGEWKFSAIGQGTSDTSISELCERYM